MAEQLTLELAIGKLAELERMTPALRKFAGDRIVNAAIRRAKDEILGGTLANSGVNRDHFRYVAATMVANVADDGQTISTGLPASDQEARILAHRETGGTITAKPDRPNPHLRIPLPPALLPSGYERNGYSGVLFRNRSAKSNPFRLQPTRRGSALLVDKRTGVAWYVLKRSVTQKPHPWWTRAGAKLRADMDAVLTQALTAWRQRVERGSA